MKWNDLYDGSDILMWLITQAWRALLLFLTLLVVLIIFQHYHMTHLKINMVHETKIKMISEAALL